MSEQIEPIKLELDEAFAWYDTQFAQAALQRPKRLPCQENERETILAEIRRCLGIEEAWVPRIKTTVSRTIPAGGFSVELLQFQSWPECRGAALLYVPDCPEPSSPLVIVACGHGAGGKNAYRAMAESIARQGCFALVPDNLGQGERQPMGHRESVVPFACGTSVQGLIVMEMMGWVRWIQQQQRFDSQRVAIIGNSGGGTLAHFLGALCRDELAAVSSSGYPGSYDYIHRKEKQLCLCNILPGFVASLEMWQVFGCIAPKPLLIFQGKGDPLFPVEYFWRTARRVSTVYRNKSAEHCFQADLLEGGHSWTEASRSCLLKWLGEIFQIPIKFNHKKISEISLETDLLCFDSWPSDALPLDALAHCVTGLSSTAEDLWDVFPPRVFVERDQRPFKRAALQSLFAQYEAALVQQRGSARYLFPRHSQNS